MSRSNPTAPGQSGKSKFLLGFSIASLVGILLLAGALAAWFAKGRAEQQEARRHFAQVREAALAAEKRAREFATTESAMATADLSAPSLLPVVVKTMPQSGATDVPSDLTELHVTFSQPMRDGSWSWVKLGDETFPKLAGTPRFLPDSRTCVLPVKLQPDKLYAVWINSGSATNFQDNAGQPALPYLLIFQTRK